MMAGEEGPLKRCITGGTTAEGEVSASEDHLLKPCNPERKVEAATAEAAEAGQSSGEKDEKEEKALEKKMTRLPQEEVDWILGREFRAPRDFEALRRSNPDLTPPADEEMDESTKLFYDVARIFYDGQESFFKFQDEVRQQYEEKHYVEVDEEYLADRAYNRAMISETRQEVCGGRAYSDNDDDECTYYSDTDDESVFTLQ
ncbi:uncharacterized protein [Miscanthus floridulus]|uniref:uncharacterized protein n=1 Tax=Miscanthus floridulus TaxID=154761 RepID=UPI00345AD871